MISAYCNQAQHPDAEQKSDFVYGFQSYFGHVLFSHPIGLS